MHEHRPSLICLMRAPLPRQDVTETDHPYLPSIRRSRMVAHCIYSDNHGKSWHIGGIATKHTNEAQVAELADGQVVLNARDWSGRFRRVIQRSIDGGSSWQQARYDEALQEPMPQGCQASMLSLGPRLPSTREQRLNRWLRSSPTSSNANSPGTLLFCNPASTVRARLTIRRSDDGGQTWPCSHLLDEGPSAYSCMGRIDQNTIGILYERADRISLAMVPLSLLD